MVNSNMLRSHDPNVINPYLKDASNLGGGYADEVVFPENEDDVIQILGEACRTRTPITIAGNGTGLVGARIPLGGIILSTEKLGGLKEIHLSSTGHNYAVTGPAITHKELQKAVSLKGLLYPPDPTEQNAFIGASVATNASGARTFKYGSTRNWIRRLKVILSTGDILDLRRGEFVANKKGRITLKGSRNTFKLNLPQYPIPEGKHSCGYYVTPGMSAIDLFIGSEGTLGVFTEIEVELIPKPEGYFSGIVFFGREEDAWRFADFIKNESLKNRTSNINYTIDACVIEYFDCNSLKLLSSINKQIPKNALSAIFFEQEIHVKTKKKTTEKWFQLCRKFDVLLNKSWFCESSNENTEFRTFRHAIPTLVNKTLRQYNQAKLGTDFTVPHEHFFDMLELYRSSLNNSGIKHCIFGHIADNHLHVNLIPQNDREAEKGWQIYKKLARQVIDWGGTISAEHGIGKIRKEYLLDMIGQSGMQEMAIIKKQLDPCKILGRGNIILEDYLNN